MCRSGEVRVPDGECRSGGREEAVTLGIEVPPNYVEVRRALAQRAEGERTGPALRPAAHATRNERWVR